MADVYNKNNYTKREYSNLYRLVYTDYSTEGLPQKKIFNFQLLESIDYSAPQGIVNYETPGGNSGLLLNTGRKTESLQLAGKLFNEYQISFTSNGKQRVILNSYNHFNYIKNQLLKIKENGMAVELFGHPILFFQNREWIIQDLRFGLGRGHDYLTFSIDLVENRQANVKTTSVNLINTGNKIAFLARLRESIISGA